MSTEGVLCINIAHVACRVVERGVHLLETTHSLTTAHCSLCTLWRRYNKFFIAVRVFYNVLHDERAQCSTPQVKNMSDDQFPTDGDMRSRSRLRCRRPFPHSELKILWSGPVGDSVDSIFLIFTFIKSEMSSRTASPTCPTGVTKLSKESEEKNTI